MQQQDNAELPRAAVSKDCSSLRQILRESTQTQHRALDQQPRLRRLLDQGITIDQYATVLVMLLDWYRVFEPALIAALGKFAPDDMQERLKTPLLLHDLAELGIRHNSGSECQALPSLGSPEAALGAAYVVEGATLGGAIICKHLRERLRPLTPLKFYSAYGDARGAMWQRFLAHLETKVLGEEMRARAVTAACETFGSLDRWVTYETARNNAIVARIAIAPLV